MKTNELISVVLNAEKLDPKAVTLVSQYIGDRKTGKELEIGSIMTANDFFISQAHAKTKMM